MPEYDDEFKEKKEITMIPKAIVFIQRIRNVLQNLFEYECDVTYYILCCVI